MFGVSKYSTDKICIDACSVVEYGKLVYWETI